MIAGQDVVVTVALTNNGVPFSTNEATYRVNGPGGLVIQDWMAVEFVTSVVGSMSFAVPASCNALSGTNTREGRVIDIDVTPENITGALRVVTDYVITQDDMPLTVMANSFQVYADAIDRADILGVELNSWAGAAYDDRVRAMVSAYGELSRLSYEIFYDRDDVYFKDRASWGIPYVNTVGRLYDYNETQFMQLDPDFIERIRQAQIIEADERLGSNPYDAEREAGILSRTAGEASHMFRPGKALRFSVSKRTLRKLGGYVRLSPGIIRS